MHSCRKWEWARIERGRERGRRGLGMKKISSNNIQLSRKCLSSLSTFLLWSSFPSDFVLWVNSWNFPVFYLFNVLSLDREEGSNLCSPSYTFVNSFAPSLDSKSYTIDRRGGRGGGGELVRRVVRPDLASNVSRATSLTLTSHSHCFFFFPSLLSLFISLLHLISILILPFVARDSSSRLPRWYNKE